MKKKQMLFAWAAAAILLTGCSAVLPDPLQKAEATLVPGTGTNLHSPLANDSNQDQQTVTLYFRYGKEPLLASEPRTLSIKQDEPAEKALVQALLAGPGANTPDLSRLFPEQVQVLSTIAQGSTLFVTFNDALLKPYSDEPSDWETSDIWRQEVSLRRRLAMAGLTASITENFPYQSVQVLVQQRGEISTSMRLENSYFQDPTLVSGLAAPFLRDETLLLTQENTAKVLLSTWQQKDWGRLYLYVVSRDAATGQERPALETAFAKWDESPAVLASKTTGGSVSHDGNKAVISVDLTLAHGDGLQKEILSYPLFLCRDGGIWKITYDHLTAMMNLLPSKEGGI